VLFFTVCAYAEVLGFHTVGQDLGASQAPMYVLAQVGGAPVLGLLIDIGALVSLFAGTLACITAASRVLLRMAHDGLAHDWLRTTHARNHTPGRAVVITGIAAVAPVALLAARGASGLDVYGWLGSLATYGFIVAYALVCGALPRYLRQQGAFNPSSRIVPGLAAAAMLLALVGNLYPEGPYGKLPYIDPAYLIAGLARRADRSAGLSRRTRFSALPAISIFILPIWRLELRAPHCLPASVIAALRLWRTLPTKISYAAERTSQLTRAQLEVFSSV
jgi:amino acid transporter